MSYNFFMGEQAMKKQKLKELLEQTKVEIADELDSFIEKIDSSTDDPNNFLTMTELEKQWKELSLKTQKIYSDLVSKSLSSVESKELRISKKDNSSRKESG
jgi:hypothetical protein